jgi:hypothetical protein
MASTSHTTPSFTLQPHRPPARQVRNERTTNVIFECEREEDRGEWKRGRQAGAESRLRVKSLDVERRESRNEPPSAFKTDYPLLTSIALLQTVRGVPKGQCGQEATHPSPCSAEQANARTGRLGRLALASPSVFCSSADTPCSPTGPGPPGPLFSPVPIFRAPRAACEYVSWLI